MKTKASHFIFTRAFMLVFSSIGLRSILAAPTNITDRAAGPPGKSATRSDNEVRSFRHSHIFAGTSESANITSEYQDKRSEPDPDPEPYTLNGYTLDSEIKSAWDAVLADRQKRGIKPGTREKPKMHPYKLGDTLSLQHVFSEGGSKRSGKLGKELGRGNSGIVYELMGRWEGFSNNVPLVAKFFAFTLQGLKEIENLQIVGELVDWGFAGQSLWAITFKKPGRHLGDLNSYQARYKIQGGCKGYMHNVREAIVKRSVQYVLQQRGAPVHTDLRAANVLLEERLVNQKLELTAHLVDFDAISLESDKYVLLNTLPDSKQKLTEIVQDIREVLEIGIQDFGKLPEHTDFSDANNCDSKP